jgi:spore germination cell wall hydrolase CwlJ-like protein
MPIAPASTIPQATAFSPAFDIVEEPFKPVEPELGPILPEASSLPAMVRAVRAEPVALTDEQQCLAVAVYFEAKGEPLDGQLAVAEVVLNRVERGRFGQGICAVVKAPKQFSFVRAGRMPTPSDAQAWKTAQAIALIAVSDGWPDIVADATHFHATRVNPGWKMRRVALIGNHIFYR